MGKSISDFIVPAALGATGFGLAGMGPMAGLFSSGAGATGALEAGATGANLLGADAAATGLNSISANSAAGLLGGTGAGLDSAGLAASQLNPALAEYAQMADGSWGQTIANDGMTFNPATGGYDKLGGFDRLMQKGGFALDGMTDTDKLGMAQKGLGLMDGGQQPQQAPKNVQQNVQRTSPSQPASYGSPSSFGANTNQVYPNFGVENAANIEAEKRRQWQAQYGQTPNFRR